METSLSPEITVNRGVFRADARNYSFLSRHLTAEPDKWRDMTDVASEYISRTRKIIEVLDGTESKRDIVDRDEEAVPLGVPDVVIYLDKSARPVSWLVDKFWSEMADKNAVKPATKFLNIDRNDEIWENLETTGAKEPTDKIYNFNRLPREKVLAVRAIFHKGELSPNNWRNEVIRKNNDLDKKNILIIDEVQSSGRTLKIAQNLLKLAFPTSNISGVYFWDSRFKMIRSNNRNLWQMTSLPIWYDTKMVEGRGVGDKNESYYKETPHSLKFRLGSFVLSAPHLKKGYERQKVSFDSLAVALRKDIDQLYRDYTRAK
ncbi:MAG TPA: hypothetical protein PKZ92_02725 [Candidatus Woesebacteria bacterium]|nr:hypothetical protein [Candidatus Shapirobacteria bacterium]HOR02150.1 hypothetical protein [Candidatus Woesebacteria bacterium]